MPDPLLDLQFQRDVSLSRAQIWEGLTNPTTLMKWFCPRPWSVVECEIDLQPGGIFRTVMQSPDGERMSDNAWCFLAIEPQQRLVWTNKFAPGFKPKSQPKAENLGFFFVVDLRLLPLKDGGTSYKANVMHENEASRKAHDEMGFQHGWGASLNQLVELYK